MDFLLCEFAKMMGCTEPNQVYLKCFERRWKGPQTVETGLCLTIYLVNKLAE